MRLPVTFVLDTGARLPLYLSVDALRAFSASGLVHTDDMDEDFVVVFGRRYRVVETPRGPGNILGLRMIMDLGLQIDVDTGTFEFERMRTHHSVAAEP